MRLLEEFISEMQCSDDYLKINELKDGFSYSIWARNAFVGVWIEDENYFLISRYKVGPTPFLAYEYHWDYDDVVGTAKPIEEIGACPSVFLKTKSTSNDLLAYLNSMEEINPVVEGFNTRKHREEVACNFKDRLAPCVRIVVASSRRVVCEEGA